MKMKRLLSLILTASLAASSFSMIGISADSGAQASENLELDMDKWGTVTVTTPEKASDTRPGDTDGKHIHVGNINKYGDSIIFSLKQPLDMAQGKYYKISFFARHAQTLNSSGDMSLRFLINNTKTNSYSGTMAIGNVAYSGISDSSLALSSEWKEYWVVLSAANTKITDLKIMRFWTANDIVPFDIDNLSIVEVTKNGSEYTPVANAVDYASDGSYTPSGSIAISEVANSDFYTMSAGTSNTSFSYGGDETLSAGEYELNAKFRLPALDYSKITYASNGYDVTVDNNKAALSVKLGGNEMKAADGSDSVTVTNEWTDAKFILSVPQTTSASGITFELDSKLALDFKDISIKKTASYSDEYITEHGNPIPVTSDERSGDTDSSYMRFIGAENTGREYVQTSTSMSAGDYIVSFWARSGETVNSPADGDGKTTMRVLLNGTEYRPGGQRGIALDSAWKHYSFTVTTAAASEKLQLRLYRHWYVDDANAPIYVDDISIVKSGTSTNLYTGVGSWDTAVGAGAGELDIIDSKEALCRVSAGSAFKYSGTDILEAGIYHIFGEFKVNEFDFNNPNAALLTAKNGSEAIKTTAGNDGVLLTNKWERGTFFLELTEPTAKSELVFSVNGNYTLDFKNLEFVNATDQYFGEWLTNDGAKLQVVEDGGETYYVAAKPESENTALAYSGDGKLEKGKWHISAKFRLVDDAEANIGASLDSMMLDAYLGSSMTNSATSFAVTDDGWTTAAFVINVTADDGIAKNLVKFELDKQLALEVCDFKFEPADAFYSDEWVSGGNVPALNISDARPGDTDGKYIHVSELYKYPSGVAYYDAAKKLNPDATYKLTVWMRALPQVGESQTLSDLNNMNVRINIGDTVPGAQNGYAIIAGALSLPSGLYSTSARLVPEWTEYTMIFKSDKSDKTDLRIGISRHWSPGMDAVPFDIDGLSLVEVDPVTFDEIGEELVTKDYLAYTAYTGAVINETVAEDYQRATAKSGNNTTLSGIPSTEYPAGIYHIGGTFRLTEYDASKIVSDTTNSYEVVKDNIFASFTAAVKGDDIASADGEAVVITNEWKDDVFLYSASEPFTAADIALTVDGALALDFKNMYILDANSLYLENWISGDGSLVGTVNDVRDDDTDKSYLHIVGPENTGAVYNDASYNLVEGGKYRLSFWARTIPFLNSPADGEGNVTVRIVMNGSNIKATVTASSVDLTTEWTQYTFVIEQAHLASGSNYKPDGLTLAFSRYWDAEDGVPFDLDGVTLVQLDENENPASENLLNPDVQWKEYTNGSSVYGDAIPEVSLETFYRVSAPAADVTSLECLDNIELEPGVYHISGKFRLPTFDFDGASAKISAKIGETKLTSNEGTTSAAVGADWTEITFILDTVVPVNMNSIILSLDSALDLDFYDLSISLVERHVSLGDVGTGFVVSLLLLKQKAIEAAGYPITWKSNGTALETVNAVLDEKSGKIGGTANAYIRYANRDHNADKLIYTNDNATLKPGTYKVTFRARTAPFLNAQSTNPAVGLRMSNGSVVISSTANRILSQGSFYGTNSIALNTAWNEYSITYRLTEETPMTYSFYGTGSGYGVAPFDIDAFSVLEVDSSTYKPKTGENLAVDSNKIKGMSAAGWTTSEGSVSAYNSTVDTYVESEYLHAEALNGENTEVNAESSRKLAVGTYYVTAKVRLADIDYAKYNFESSSVLTCDNNKAELSAKFKDILLKTADGKDSITVTPEWTDAIFVMPVSEETNLRSLVLTLDSSLALDFDYINVDTKIKKEIAVDTSEAGEWSNGMLPPLPTITEGNLLEGALDDDKLPYWECSEQTLTAGIDENGNPYLAASDIKNNTLGFTYNPGYTLAPGLYKLSVDVRTTNSGESGIMRMLVNGQYKCYSTAISNEWRTVQMAFEVKQAEYLTLKLYGGLVATSVQDYEIKNLTLVDVVAELEGQNLAELGSFDNAESLGKWVAQKEATLTWNEDGYLSITDRVDSIAGAVYNIDLGFAIPAGTKFKVSYDIRAGKAGDNFKVRTFIGSVGLDVADYAFEYRHYEYYITNEWEHVDSTYVSVGDDYLKFVIQGGVNAEDIGDIDFDNLVVEIVR